jgi:hypothetical protein
MVLLIYADDYKNQLFENHHKFCFVNLLVGYELFGLIGTTRKASLLVRLKKNY